MTTSSNNSSSILTKLWRKIKSAIVQDLPVELDACELCRKTECSQGHWQDCTNRIEHAKRLEIDRAKQSS